MRHNAGALLSTSFAVSGEFLEWPRKHPGSGGFVFGLASAVTSANS